MIYLIMRIVCITDTRYEMRQSIVRKKSESKMEKYVKSMKHILAIDSNFYFMRLITKKEKKGLHCGNMV